MTANFKITQVYARLVVSDAAAAIDFYKAALGASEIERYTVPNGKIVHAAVRIGDAVVAVKDEGDGDLAPDRENGTPVIMALDVDNADALGDSILRAGGTIIYPISDWSHGSRGGRFADPFGHQWMVSQQIEELSPEEIQRRTNDEAS